MSETTTETAPVATTKSTSSRGLRKERVGQVVSTKMAKTAVVETTTRVPHAKFGKIVKQVKRFYAHDEENKFHAGDAVQIEESRPISKRKSWVVLGAASGVAPGLARRRARAAAVEAEAELTGETVGETGGAA